MLSYQAHVLHTSHKTASSAVNYNGRLGLLLLVVTARPRECGFMFSSNSD